MSRRKGSTKREVHADPIFNDITITKFINRMMYDGKKSTAAGLFYGSLEEIKTKITTEEPIAVFKKALENVKPSLEVRSRRVGGANYQVPREVRPERRRSLAFRWIVAAARNGKGKPMHLKLADELMNAVKNEGSAMKKREDMHRMAESNRAFAHLAW